MKNIASFEEKLKEWASDFYSAEPLGEAFRYALLGGGKRVRPLLTLLSYKACGGISPEKVWKTALAVEMIHTYSLIHDDLPAMDDDDMRRGRPSLHKQYDEATAILVGDALLTDAFLVLTQMDLAPSVQSQLVRELATAAGSLGMVRGQALDMHWTNRSGGSWEDLQKVHRDKTGKLIAASCAMGAWCATENVETVEKMRDFGLKVGLAFQAVDDWLDTQSHIGKTTGKDKEQGKLTHLSCHGAVSAAEYAQQCTQSAKDCLSGFDTQTVLPLQNFIGELVERSY
ncbi:MAG: polyprenyl synthetase family protein [Oligoflexales bacterium]